MTGSFLHEYEWEHGSFSFGSFAFCSFTGGNFGSFAGSFGGLPECSNCLEYAVLSAILLEPLNMYGYGIDLI
jgi:hypothetical protein